MKVLILTASFGDGHNAAARNVRDAFEKLDPEQDRVEVLDLLEVVYGRLNQWAKTAYLGLVRYAPGLWGRAYDFIDRAPGLAGLMIWSRLRKALEDILQAVQPDVVISTYPIYADVVAELFRFHAERCFRFYTVITDSISVNAAWLRSPSDLYFVANDPTAEVLMGHGIGRERIAVTGFPVSPAFLDEDVPEIGAPVEGGSRRILFVTNHGLMKAGRVLEDLLEIPNVELTIAVGRDGNLKASLDARLATYGPRVRILGWTNLMPRLLLTHHLVIGKAGGATVQEAIAARCPILINHTIPGQEEGNAQFVTARGLGCVVETREGIVEAVRTAFADDALVWRAWRSNLDRESRPGAAYRIADLVLREEALARGLTDYREPGGPLADYGRPITAPAVIPAAERGPLLCDFHTHTTYSDGGLTVRELIDFYGQRSFDCIAVTDHLADPELWIGRLSRLSRLTLSPAQIDEYFEVIRREADRAWRRYRMLVLPGIEFNKDGCRPKTSAHLLGIDLKHPIAPDLDLRQTIRAIHEQGGLAVASHPHLMRSEWGKNTLYLWENQDVFAPLLDAWEIANRDNFFAPVAHKRLPFLANSDFHKPAHIYSWKTVLDCPKDRDAIKECVRRNERVSITLYRRSEERRAQGVQDPLHDLPSTPVTCQRGPGMATA